MKQTSTRCGLRNKKNKRIIEFAVAFDTAILYKRVTLFIEAEDKKLVRR